MNALDVLYPPRCGGCDAPGAWTCPACRDGRERAAAPRPRHVRSLEALGAFAGPLRRAIHRLKYAHESVLADALGAELGLLAARGLALGWRVDGVVGVPLARRRVRERGYDQGERLARSICRVSGIRHLRALRRKRETASQVGLGRDARRANVREAFAADPVDGGILLVDDVCTTGATLSECALTLRRAGAREVRALVLAVER